MKSTAVVPHVTSISNEASALGQHRRASVKRPATALALQGLLCKFTCNAYKFAGDNALV